jgi:23S rRNA pseudouridine1911/1915/1917 synthase
MFIYHHCLVYKGIALYFCIMNKQEEFIEEEQEGETLFEKKVILVDKGQEPLRIDKYVMVRIMGATRSKLQRGIDAGLVTVNGKPVKSNYKVRPLDEIVVYTDIDPELNEVLPEELPLNIVYEDEHIIIINKESGMVVHPGCGNYSGTLINGIAGYLKKSNPTLNEDNALPRFGLVHRIDKFTTGLLVLAKTDIAMQSLAKQFSDHTVKRKYIALVWGNVEADKGTIVAHVGRHQRFRKMFTAYPDGDFGKDATTHYTVLERMNYVSLVECVLETGRTHQIRVHFKHLGHPLFADDTYGGNRIVKGTVYTKYKQFVDNCFTICNRQALHAQTLGFIHPGTGKEVFFESELPNDLSTVIQKWRTYVAPKNHEN